MTSMRKEIETWAQAIQAYEEDDYVKALDLFGRIAESGKIQTNIGIIYATLGEHESAVDHFTKATQLDQWLGIAYFQCGVSNFLLGLYEEALKNFEEAAVTLRENTFIDYSQIGLNYRLELAEVLFNRGLCLVYLGAREEGFQTMQEAAKYKATPEHDVIEEAIQDGGDGYTVFSISVGLLYKPPAQKAANTTPKDYLGKTIMVVGDSAKDAYSEFAEAAAERAAQGGGSAPKDTKRVERPPTNVDGAAPPLITKNKGANNSNGASGNTPWIIGSNVRPNNGIIPPSQSEPLKTNGPKLGGVPTRFGTISGGSMGNAGLLSRAASLAPPGQGPSRGMTISRSPSALSAPPAPIRRTGMSPPRAASAPAAGDTGYDDILGDYGEGEEMGRPRRKPTMIGPGPGPGRAISTKLPSSYASSATNSPSRNMQRQRTMASSYSRSIRAVSVYDEDGEMPLRIIKVKLHCNGNVRGMAMPPDVPMEEFFDLVATKFGMNVSNLNMKFVDEDGTKVSLLDESDYDLALATARENAKGKSEGKLTVWVE